MGAQAAAFGLALKDGTAAIVRALILEIGANLRASPATGGTPVDTGHARANWVESVGAPWLEEIAGAALADNLGAILNYKLADGPAFISNNVPYIELLDLFVAPGFVEVAIARALQTVNARYGQLDAAIAAHASNAGAGGAAGLAATYFPL